MEKSERLGRQARLGFEPGTFRLPVLSVTAIQSSLFKEMIEHTLANIA